jgi:hypothetical protein
VTRGWGGDAGAAGSLDEAVWGWVDAAWGGGLEAVAAAATGWA